MYILNLETKELTTNFSRRACKKGGTCVILATPKEFALLQSTMPLEKESPDQNMYINLFDEYDFFNIKTCYIKNKTSVIKEMNLYLSSEYTVIVVDKDHYIYSFIKEVINGNVEVKNSSTFTLQELNYLIVSEIITKTFLTLENLEEKILKTEDKLINFYKEINIEDINWIRSVSRSLVRHIRPLLYIGDRIIKKDVIYSKIYNDNSSVENIQNLDLGIDNLLYF